MRLLVDGLGDQVRWAVDLDIPPMPQASEVLVCGMGGSAVSGDYLTAVAAVAGRRVGVHRGYRLPGWARTVKPLVLALSYSGNTEETLTAVEQAADDGLEIAAVTSGGMLADMAGSAGWPLVEVPAGMQPRAALGHMLGASARLCGAAGVVPGVIDDLSEAAEVLSELIEGGSAWALAQDLAGGLEDKVVLIYGSQGLTEPATIRWKTQINENSKRPAWAGTLPEVDHNEIVGWSAAPVLSRRVGIIALRDEHEAPEIARRFAVTWEVTDREVAWVGEVWAQGRSMLARLLSLTLVGDMTSVELAERDGVDPMPVEVIETLKRRLREEA